MIRRRRPLRRKKRPRRQSKGRKAEERREADKLWTAAVLARDQECRGWRREKRLASNWWQPCHATTYLQAHHVIKKSKSKAMRHVLENGVTLCRGCHWYCHWHLDATETVGWYKLMAIDYEALLQRSRIRARGFVDMAAVILSLKAACSERQDEHTDVGPTASA